MPSYHYPIGGSTAARTVECPGWLELAKTMPKQPASEFAARGTILHDLIERMINDNIADAAEFENTNHHCDGFDYTISADDVDRLNEAYACFVQLCEDQEIEVWDTEIKVEINKDIGGTTDLVAIGKSLVILDWKFGEGIQVDAEDNKQAWFYAACFLSDPSTADLRETWAEILGHTPTGDDEITVVIVQPNTRGYETMRQDTVTYNQVDAFAALIEQRAEVALKGGDTKKAGSWCGFCPAAAVCPEKTGEARAALMIDPASANFRDLEKAMHYVEQLEVWMRTVRGLVHQQAELGNVLPGWKLVNKRATRKWRDPDDALAKFKAMRRVKLEDVIKPQELISPTEFEKACKKLGLSYAEFEDMVIKQSSGTKLAKDDDPGSAALSRGALEDFVKRHGG